MKRKSPENPNKTDQPCPKCKAPLYRRSVQVVRGSCWKCQQSMPIAFGNNGVMMMSPKEFVPLEIEEAMKAGALLREQFSRTTQSTYLANTCNGCGAFCGDFHLHDFWYEEPIAPPVDVVLGCLECFTAMAITPAADGTLWRGVIPHEVEDIEDAVLPAPPAPAPTKSPKPSRKESPPKAQAHVTTSAAPSAVSQ